MNRIVLSLLLFSITARLHAEPETVALLPVDYLDAEENRFDAEQASGFEDAVRRGAAAAGAVVVDRAIVANAAATQGLSVDRCVNEDCLSRIRSGTGADHALKVSVEQDGALYTFTLSGSPSVPDGRRTFSGPRSDALRFLETLITGVLSKPAPPAAVAVPEPVVPKNEPEPKPASHQDTPPKEATSLQTIFGYTLLGLGAASVVTGGVFVGLDGNCRNDGCDHDTTDPTIERWDSAVQGWVLVGVGAAALGGGLLMLLLDDGDGQKTAAGAMPVAGGAVLGIGRKF